MGAHGAPRRPRLVGATGEAQCQGFRASKSEWRGGVGRRKPRSDLFYVEPFGRPQGFHRSGPPGGSRNPGRCCHRHVRRFLLWPSRASCGAPLSFIAPLAAFLRSGDGAPERGSLGITPTLPRNGNTGWSLRTANSGAYAPSSTALHRAGLRVPGPRIQSRRRRSPPHITNASRKRPLMGGNGCMEAQKRNIVNRRLGTVISSSSQVA